MRYIYKKNIIPLRLGYEKHTAFALRASVLGLVASRFLKPRPYMFVFLHITTDRRMTIDND
ncbi:hypothetical protein Hanom_Chr15g01376721 [Helianthus anomalus]